MRNFRLFSVAAIAVLLSTSAFAASELDSLREKYNLPARFDANMIRQGAGDEAVKRIREIYKVDAGFTSEDIIRVSGEQAVQKMRHTYSIGPSFTCKDLRRALGARALAEKMEQLKLSPGFTQDDYAQALAREEVRWGYLGIDAGDLPADANVYAQRKAERRMQEKVKYYPGLSEHFSYQQYREVVGPSQAGFFRLEYGFERTATYEEMVTAIAKQVKQDFAKNNNVRVDWTMAEILKELGEKRLRWQLEDLKITGPISEATLAEAYGARDISWNVRSLKDRADCTEAEIARTRGEESARNVQAEYDLDETFTEAQVREAAGQNAMANIRRTFGVTNIKMDDLEKADKRLTEERAAATEKWKKCMTTYHYDYSADSTSCY